MLKNERKRLLLIGTGPAHLAVLEVLRNRHVEWRDELDITLISETTHVANASMIPGLIAGHYRTNECYLDLRPLTQSAGVALAEATVTKLDLTHEFVVASEREWPFDLLSVDIESVQTRADIEGDAANVLQLKPVDAFLQQWRNLQTRVAELTKSIHLVIVGGESETVEIALAMAHRLKPYRAHVKWSLVCPGELLPGYPRRAAKIMARHLAAAGIALRTNAPVAAIETSTLRFADGSSAAFDELINAEGATVPGWLRMAGLASVGGGFVRVDERLQSLSHPQVFAAGKITSHSQDGPLGAGVQALRQGSVLAENLLRGAAGHELKRYQSRRRYVSLMSTGSRHAIAALYGVVVEGDWIWRWKNRVDMGFMRRFSEPFNTSDTSVDERDSPSRK